MRVDGETCAGACANGEFPDVNGRCEFGCPFAAWGAERGLVCVKECAGVAVPGVLGPRTAAKLCAGVPAGEDLGAVCAAVGKLYSRGSGECVSECAYRNGSVCEVLGSQACPRAFRRKNADSAGSVQVAAQSEFFECAADCGGLPAFAGECVTRCPASAPFLDVSGGLLCTDCTSGALSGELAAAGGVVYEVCVGECEFPRFALVSAE